MAQARTHVEDRKTVARAKDVQHVYRTSERLIPKPGTFAVSDDGGFDGFFIKLLTRSRVSHAFMVVDEDHVMEMVLGGARISPLKPYFDNPKCLFAYGQPLTDAERVTLVTQAHGLVDRKVGYDLMDIAALGMVDTVGLRTGHLTRRVEDPSRMICSQSVDWLDLQAGVHLFDDGRLPQEVDPGDLEWLMMTEGWAKMP